ncbi:MAG: hypothetical protein K2K79_02830 [Paramuribaculum sp.]|nr:hypothetical protein [Paramuribaculum sp.]
MKIRLSLLILGLLLAFPLRSEIDGSKACGTSMTVAEIRINQECHQPVFLMVGITIGESLEIDSLESVSSFINSICAQSKYIPPTYTFFTSNVYTRYWTYDNKDTFDDLYWAGAKFGTEFKEKSQACKRQINLRLEDSAMVEIKYFDIYGFFIYGNKETLFPLGSVSLGINYMNNEFVKDIWFIMSVVCYQKTAGDFIRIDPANQHCILSSD